MFKRRFLITFVSIMGAALHFRHAQAQAGGAKDVLRKAENIAKEREELEKKLISIVYSKDGDGALARKRQVIELLGKMGTERSVPVLIDVISNGFDGVEVVDHDGLAGC